jgi:hypothetical protein
MSELKRYGHKAIIYPKSDDDTYITIPVEQEDGQWVAYSDYTCLKAENARLRAEVERLRASSFVTAVPSHQYERIVKAGDELHAFLINYIVESRISSAYLNKLDDDWNAAKNGWDAAKEGKQT